jgi:Cohesin domain
MVILVATAVFASGMVDPSKMRLLGYTPIEPNAGETVFIAPSAIIGDYFATGFQVGNTVSVHVNVSSVTDLYAYAVNVTWNPAMLTYTGLAYGEFLARTGSAYGTSRSQPTVKSDNVLGCVSVAETILGDVAGITGSGRLFTLQFTIAGYGETNLGISSAGFLPTKLLTSTGSEMTFATTSGYFRNALTGDATLNKIVDTADISKVIFHRTGPPAGPGGYNRAADINDNTIIDTADISLVIANRGRTAP